MVNDSTWPTPGVDCSTASSTGKMPRAAASISASRRRVAVSGGSVKLRWGSTRRRTKGSAMSAVQPARLDLYLTSPETGGRLAWRRAVWTWPYSSARWRTRRRRAGKRAGSPPLFRGEGEGGGELPPFGRRGGGGGCRGGALGLVGTAGFSAPGRRGRRRVAA